MSIIYCEKHDRRWDSDKLDECPLCENEHPEGNTPMTDALVLHDLYGVASDIATLRIIEHARQIERENMKLREFLREVMGGTVRHSEIRAALRGQE